MAFKIGTKYSRKDINNEIGGETVSYLPQKNGQIICGCFTRELNTDVPLEVQVGIRPTVVAKAQLLERQSNKIIPVFVQDSKATGKKWVYQGLYEFIKLVRDKSTINAAAKKSGRMGKLTYLIRFKKV